MDAKRAWGWAAAAAIGGVLLVASAVGATLGRQYPLIAILLYPAWLGFLWGIVWWKGRKRNDHEPP